MIYEYKVIPAPARGQKGKGIKGAEGRFANALELQMNALATEGWEFLRAETLPNEERSGLTGTQTTYRSVMVFRRAAAGTLEAFEPETLVAEPTAELPAPTEDAAETDAEGAATAPEDPDAAVAEDAVEGAAVEEADQASVPKLPEALKKRVETLEQP